MTPDTCRAFARYNRWMNAKVYTSAAALSDEERKRDRGAFFGSVHRTLNHILVADRIWLGRLAGVVPAAGFMADGIKSLDHEIAPDFEQLRRERDITDDALEAWAETLTAQALAGTVRIHRRGQQQDVPLWWIASHVFNHQTHHRGQVTTLLTQAGQDPGVTDLFAMLQQEAGPSA